MTTELVITAILAAMIGVGILAWIAFGLGEVLEKEWLVHVGGITAISLLVILAGGLIWGATELLRLSLAY